MRTGYVGLEGDIPLSMDANGLFVRLDDLYIKNGRTPGRMFGRGTPRKVKRWIFMKHLIEKFKRWKTC